MPLVINFTLFQVVYAASIAGVVFGYAWLGLVALAAFMGWHAQRAPTARADFLLVGVAVLVGLMLDTLYIQSGLLVYRGELLWTGAAPLWILALWANFALTMNGCLAWLRQRMWLAAVLSLVGGPLSYYGGVALGAATVTADEWKVYAAIGVTWALAVPFLLAVASHFTRRLHPDLHVHQARTSAA